MMRSILFALSVFWASQGVASDVDMRGFIQEHVLPRYSELAKHASWLALQAQIGCSSDYAPLIAQFHVAFDKWVAVSHLRFGPSEDNDRAYALAFWPDPRGSTPKALAAMIASKDQAVTHPDQFAAVSVAARGFYALEFLLFDPQFVHTENSDYRCALVRAIALDIAANATAIRDAWYGGYGEQMMFAGGNTYRSQTEATRKFFTALKTGLEFTSRIRIGRPLGTFDRPRPKRAEARRSKRSLRHVILSLISLRTLALHISERAVDVLAAFDIALKQAHELNDPIFAGVATGQGRLRLEALQNSIDRIESLLIQKTGPSLGIKAGFNALDGD
jgi:predicted lipoprotein